ncbi:MAG: DUF3667 domain-containing protein [Flavobacteriaceae bacterium]
MKKLRIRKKKEIALHQILPECLNCGKPLASDDVFCSYCGQKNVEKLNFSSFIGQLISGIFSYDSRFWTTFVPLLLKPGVISRNYIDGKRKRYVNPFQLYLQVSILFFLILGLTSNFDPTETVTNIPGNIMVSDSIIPQDVKDEILKEIDTVDQQVIKSLFDAKRFSEMIVDSTYQYKIQNDTIKKVSFSDRIQDFYVYQHRNKDQIETKPALTELGYPLTFWNTFYYEQMQRFRSNFNSTVDDNGKGFVKNFISKLSIGLFIFLPLFALFFKIIYYRKHMNYMEHLVFVFHTQTVFFLLMIIYILITLVTDFENTAPYILLFLVYLYMALRKFYQQGWFKTLVKFFILNIIYINIGGLAMLIISFIAFMFG